MNKPTISGGIVALDVGSTRIGVAAASEFTRIARPVCTLANDESVWESLSKLWLSEEARTIVVGLPRNLNGADTEQTTYAREFAEALKGRYDGTVALQDEALTSVKAEQELRARGKPYEKSDIDALAAVYILEDYMRDQGIL